MFVNLKGLWPTHLEGSVAKLGAKREGEERVSESSLRPGGFPRVWSPPLLGTVCHSQVLASGVGGS